MVRSFVFISVGGGTLKVTNSFTLDGKLIIFIDTEVNPSPALKALLENELKRYSQGFFEVTIIGAEKSAMTYSTA